MKIIMQKDNRFWSGNTEGDTIHTEHGTINGKMTQRSKICKPRNTGRSNATTGAQQAEKELLSTAKKKYDKGYDLISPESLPGFEREFIPIRPMLAQTFSAKLINQFPDTVFIQPKLDGVRCIIFKSKETGKIILHSRQGKAFNLPHITDELEDLFNFSPDIILDGELYIHNHEFQDIISLVKKDQERTAQIEYHIYDLVQTNMIFTARVVWMDAIFAHIDSNKIKRVSTLLMNQTSIPIYVQLHIEQGYEGTMIRNPDSHYKIDKRSKDLLKHKEFEDAEFTIIGGEKESLQDGTEGVVYTVKNIRDNIQFNVRPKGNMASRAKALLSLEDDIGKQITVRYQGVSTNGVPRFPVAIGVRDYE